MSLPHGGNIYHYSRKYGVPESEILDFSASINPLGPSKMAMRAMREAAALLVNYPDPDCAVLKDAIAAHYGIPRESILIGNGSTELIYLLPRALSPMSAIVPAPGFSDYSRALKLACCRVDKFPLNETEGFAPDMDALVRAARGSEMLFLCNPHNPTGALTGRAEVMRLAHETYDTGAFIVVDEAFMDYAPEESVIREAARSENVAVLRNFTKFHAMPGLRIGYLVSHPWVVRRLEAVREPWSVNILGERAAAASLADADYAKRSLVLAGRERAFLARGLEKLGLRTYPSAANFLLVKTERDADELAESLAVRGILIRSCANFRGLDGRYFRVAVKSRKDNKTLLDALAEEMGR